MSAPQTNLETQQRRHRGPIVGIVVVVIFALGLLVWQMLVVADEGTPIDSGAGQIDGRTGEEVPEVPNPITQPVPQPAPQPATPPAPPPAADPPMVPPADPVVPPPAANAP